MQENPLTAQDIECEISDITEMIERGKVKLTPDVSEYLHDWMEIILRKVEKGMDVTKIDLSFLTNVRFWMSMPEEWRKENPDISELVSKTISEIKSILSLERSKKLKQEAIKRRITIMQMYDLVRLFSVEWTRDSAGNALYLPDDIFNRIDEEFKCEGGKIYSKGNLNLSNFPFPGRITNLPDGLIINGHLWLEKTNIQQLPEGIIIKGDLRAINSELSEFPRVFQIERSISLTRSKAQSLPEGLIVKGNFTLNYSEVKKLPKGLEVYGSLFFVASKIEEIPDNTTVGIDIIASDLKCLTTVGDNVKVGGIFDASNAGIVSFGENFESRELYLRDVPLIKLPKVNIAKDLRLQGSKIRSIGEGTKVGNQLQTGEALKQLPDELNVKVLDITRSKKLSALPDDFRCQVIQLGTNSKKRLQKNVLRLEEEGRIEHVKYSADPEDQDWYKRKIIKPE